MNKLFSRHPNTQKNDISYFEKMTFQCPKCGRHLQQDVWLVISAAERADLVQKAMRSELHLLICESCRYSGQIPSPLIVFFEDRQPNLVIFVANPNQMPKVNSLLQICRQKIGKNWKDEWLSQSMTVPKGLEGIVLGGAPSGLSGQSSQLEIMIQQAYEQEDNYKKTGNPSMLDNAISIWEQLIKRSEFNDSPLNFRFAVLHDAGGSYLQKFRITAGSAEITKAINYWEKGLSLAISDVTAQSKFLLVLSMGWIDRFNISKNPADIDSAIRYCNKGISIIPKGEMNYSDFLITLGQALMGRYRHSGSLNDLNDAIKIFEETSEIDKALSGSNPLRYSISLHNLGMCYIDRYDFTGEFSDVESAVMTLRDTLILMPLLPLSSRPGHFNTLAVALRKYYVQTGEIDKVNEAIKLAKEALNTPGISPSDRCKLLITTGNCLVERFSASGSLTDLDIAIETLKESIAIMHGTASLSTNGEVETSLGGAYFHRHRITGNPSDLNETISWWQQALKMCPVSAPVYSGCMSNLSTGLRHRYLIAGDLNDLDNAIHYWKKAIENSHSSSLKSMSLNNLGNGYSDRYIRLKEMDDLENAISAFQESLALTPDTMADYASRLFNLGSSLMRRYLLVGESSDINKARDHFKNACLIGLNKSLEVAISSSRMWGNWALEREQWSEAIQAFDYGLSAIDHAYKQHMLRSHKELWLSDAQEIPRQLAFALIKNNQHARGLEVLENWRARLLTEALEQNRRDLENLPKLGREKEYKSYCEAVDRLSVLQRRAQNEIPPQLTRSLPSQSMVIDDLVASRADLDKAIEIIQKIPGYEGFFQPLAYSRILEIAAHTPLVYLLTTTAGGAALIVNENSVETIWLEALNEDALRLRLYGENTDSYMSAYSAWVRSISDCQVGNDEKHSAIQIWFSTLDEMTAWLWTAGMGQIVNHLKTQGIHQTTLIPTGMLNLLPLHAAWTPDANTISGRLYALDAITFMYAPSARALLQAQETASAITTPDTLLAIDNPDGSLPSSAYEVQAAKSGFGRSQHFSGSLATRQAVLGEISNYSVLHFSTHGHAGWNDPLKGGLLLADGELTLTDLLALPQAKIRLAVLSACETGIPGTKLPEEVISLPSGCLQSGIAGVVSSLWSVADISTAMLFVRFYSLWRKEGLSPFVALCQAQLWIRDSTNLEKKVYFKSQLSEFSTAKLSNGSADAFFQYISLQDDEMRKFSHPFYWAAFTYTGA